MRVGKSIALAIIVLFGLVMQCEIFQTNLGNFDTGEYQSIEISYESEQERKELLSKIVEKSNKYSVHPFTTSLTYYSDIGKTLSIYGDSYVWDTIKKEQGISNRLYCSLSNGNTQTEYRNFEELFNASEQPLYSISFVGDSEDIYAVYKELWDSYNISAPGIHGSNEYDMTFLIWITIDIVMLLISILCVALKKKETTIRISMGQNPWSIIMKNVLVELLVDLLLFIGVKALSSLFISGIYMEKTVMGIYLAGVGISCLTYVSFAFYDIRRAFSHVFVTGALKNTIYVLKFVVSIGTVFTIITNISLVLQNRMSIGDTDFVEAYRDYSYIELMDRDLSLDADSTNRIEEMYDLYNQIYAENYSTLQPVISGHALADPDRGIDYVLVNEYGAPSLESFVQGLDYDEDADVIYFIPEEYDTDMTMEDARSCLRQMINDVSELKEETVVYQNHRSFSYIDRNLENNMSTIQNPVVIYAKFHGADYANNLYLEDTKNVMFRLTDEELADIIETYGLEEKGYDVRVTKVTERFDYYNNVLRQGIAFCSSVAVFILILHIILTITIVLMEYKNNAMEFSLKKILGYGLLKRSENIICFSILSNLIVIIIAVMLGILSQKYSVKSAVSVGLTVLAIELAIEIFNILRIERDNLLKTLKGGCL